jgi:bifunctional DNA-binding transcriptional regulator/antitoxin component of YhaV-PrlF toxin-antitoxin module
MASTTLLAGDALLNKARDLSNSSPEEIARACGYIGPAGRVLKKSFLRALVEAKGFITINNSQAEGLRGRQAEYRTRVHGNGNLLVGNAYTRRLGLEPGQECRIELHQETGTIWLRPLEPGEPSAADPVDQVIAAGEES